MSKDLRQKIKEAIQQFDNGNLSENALNLFQVLGYITERQAPLGKPTYATFKDSFIDDQSRFDENKALVKEWKYVDLLFQLSKEEMSRQLSLFDTRQVDRTVIETYLFFTIELAKEHYSRTELSHITREVNRLFPMPVMILFKHGFLLTLSVINRRLHKRDDNKDVLEKVTLIKDVRISPAGGGVHRTGVENVSGTHRAHIEILFDLSFDELKNKHGFTNFVELHEAWQKTLDTSELNKRFFRELANWYFWAMDYVEFPDDVEKKKDIRNATNLIRLITRVVFIWFIKEKDLVPEILFNKNQLSTILNNFNKNERSDTYYKAILQNLFFGTLNQNMGERAFAKEGSFPENKNEYGVKNLFRYADKFSIKEKEAIKVFSDTPFLNGGLFDCLDKPNDEGKIVYADGFSRNSKKQAKVPDFLFFNDELEVDLNEIYGTKNKKYKVKGLINLLNSYKFTVAENTPIEEEIALDPELLGKVFENLLASYNPETQTTARKQTGSFYTPREIVNYMVDESLIAYLSTASIPPDSTASIPAGGNDYNYPFFNPYDEIKIHQGNLPHWQQEDVFYFVTFRLADSIPKEKVEQLRQDRETWLKNHPKNKEGKYSTEELKEYYRLFSKRVEEWLDKGAGGCILREEKYARIIADALLCFNNQRYILDKWVVMPNHVHVLVKPLKNYNLTDILHSWKSYTANQINKYAGGKGQLWMHESYEHIVRNREAFEAIRNYIRQNPAKAGITLPDCAKSWTESTANIPVGGGILADSCSLVRIVRSKDAPDTLKARLRKLLSYSDERLDFTEGETKLIISAIDNCKILDPACGSGAFPMGILHKLVHILHKLDPRNELWKQRQVGKALQIDDPNIREHAIQDIEEAFENNELDYGRKLYLIENCIYGVDIQPIAVQIAKLRFFISLIIDEKKQPGKENLGIRSLPNLETKFVAANTLIALDKPQGQLSFRNPEIERLERELKEMRHGYFNAKTRKEKLQCQKQDKKLRQDIAGLLVNDGWNNTTARQVVAFDLYDQNASADFFDPEWMFGLKEGFNVVIGNPPYVQIQNFSGMQQQQKDWEKQKYETYTKTGDVYCLFYERGYRLLKDGGVLTFITSNKWMRANYGRVMRKFFTGNGTISQLIDFGDSPIFENATTYTNILVWKKDKQEVKTRAWDLSKAYASNVSLDDLLVQQGECEPLFNENSFVVVKGEQTAIKKRIEEIGVPLKDWNISIYRGILTGLNEAFIIDGKKKDELIAKDPKSAEIIKPILRGRDIKRYKAEFADLWLINTHNGYTDKNGHRIPRVDVKKDYPALWEYLSRINKIMEGQVEKRYDHGDHWSNLRNCAYLNEIEKEKIFYAEIVFDSAFHYDTNLFYPEATTFIVTGERLKYLTALLNSKLLTYAFRTFYAGGDLRGNTFRYKKVFVELLPVPKLSPESQLPFEILVDCILFCKERNLEQESGLFESVIDGMVYELYFPEEIKTANGEMLKHIAKLPEFKNDWSNEKKLAVIKKVYKELSDPKHPISVAMFKMDTIKEIRIIEGKQ
ncbi:MAG: hypothetical protein DWB56_08055 [Candidatus Jettenia sp.]|uniref:site-specific DNA-methyltransferase (adenine-specific) n=1 Tax=Candidatus Jettenia caeni TaxID=247490 RepID=I3IJE9_9BACT|nr:Eco57I restriction-modification methylase domain-containing protein [Candidatus Jettenia sp. AMX1]MBC6928898.1 hypothetical protein [Candidatus Jettenia sp.]GAB61844.1 conserved hypothetical protein [Candidatus Jettenia caeni]KAA0250858.1 MAG: hypothetical protein EDM77_03360 [Candidatus Jettenia sp. AMX1]MCE7879900.1 hypothetical protein [Candidatus Jettenia sp. AMX1]MCQ3926679.1 hypothetical protein [Candidatus Jettenia sp.]